VLEATARTRPQFAAIIALSLRLEGTVTGEHGVGTLERAYLAGELGDDALHHAIKRALDTAGS
jgi:glycolate oxidase